MADPLSVMALMGLIYAGKTLSEREVPVRKNNPEPENSDPFIPPNAGAIMAATNFNTDFKVNGEERALVSNEVQTPFTDLVKQSRSSGQEVLDMKDRFVTDLGVMNNLSPIEKQQVGPGLGVAADVPAVGGFQQMFRAMPENVGAYRMTTLPGRPGPAGDISGGRGTLPQQIGHNRPEKTAHLPSRLPPTQGRAQGQGGAITGDTGRQHYERSKRSTHRAQTSYRSDGLNFAPAKHFVGSETLSQDPTRNKSDITGAEYKYQDRVTPGVSSFYGGYSNSSLIQATNQGQRVMTAQELAKYGLRYSERRSQADRPGNAGRMNVRAGPLNQGGIITSVRSDNSRVDGRLNPVSGGWTQQYVQTEYQQLNPYKGQANTRLDLDIAKRQLANNPLANSLSG
uniref:DUF5899 domain-containing protein n=1 Tax=viral metagenome TaxID=1070528 RepID=A0A6C0JYX1_9ZZZZ